MNVLCVNAGSSSLKVALYAADRAGERRVAAASDTQNPSALLPLVDELHKRGAPAPDAIGHRFVHGGTRHLAPARVDDVLVAELEELVPLAPNHLPAELQLLALARRSFPSVPHVVCFDTAFHRTMPPEAQHFGLPHALFAEGVQRFGFHGLSYEFVVGALGPALRPRTIIAHLGAGASMVALADGVSVDTTMGLTPLGGLVMATRPGDLDPGVLLYLQRTPERDADALSQMLSLQSGLLGISGLSGDMKTLLAARATHPGAALAVKMFVRTAQKTIGALAAVLGGVDLLVFTGGIGEHAPTIRAEICAPLAHLGLVIDDALNQANAAVIDDKERIAVVATDEDRMIARHTARLLSG